MHNDFLKRAAKIGFFLGAATAGGGFYFGGLVWAGGVLVAACWMFVNTYFLFRLVSIGMRVETQKNPKYLLVLSILKFPAIYLVGYFILMSRFFPIESILAGLTAMVVGLASAWTIQRRKDEGRGTREEGRKTKDEGRAVGNEDSKCHPRNLLSGIKSIPAFAGMTFVLCGPVFAADPSHGSHGESQGASLHTTNLVGLVGRFLPESAQKTLASYENVIFGVLVILILSLIFFAASRNMKLIPGRFQSACETVVEGLNGFVCGIIGPEGKKFTPFLGTLFLYILTMNLLGLIPLMKSNTANSMTLAGPVALPIPTTTVALALIVFVTVQAIGIKKQGLLGYLDHMAGTPRDAFGFVMAPLMFPIHLIGEIAKPFSLTFRLFCNTMGGHILVAVFIGMGVGAMFIPFQAPFLLFEIATSTIQAFVFTLLSTVYIAMMMPHGDHEKHHAAEVHH